MSLVRRGRIPRTRETWLGPRFTGHMTGFPSVDVRSIGAGGGSIAWVDEGGLARISLFGRGRGPGPRIFTASAGREATVKPAIAAARARLPRFVDLPRWRNGARMSAAAQNAVR